MTETSSTTLYMLTDERWGDPMVYASRDAMLADAPRAYEAHGHDWTDKTYAEFVDAYEAAFTIIELDYVSECDHDMIELAGMALGCLFSDQDDIAIAITNALAEARRIDDRVDEPITVVEAMAMARPAQWRLASRLDALITVAEAAELYQIQPSAVRLACAKRWIPARQSGSTWLMRRADADARWGDRVLA